MKKTMTFKTMKLDFSKQLRDFDDTPLTEPKVTETKNDDGSPKTEQIPVTLKTVAMASLKSQDVTYHPSGIAQRETLSVEETIQRVSLGQIIARAKGPVELENEDITFLVDKIVKYMPAVFSMAALAMIEAQSVKQEK